MATQGARSFLSSVDNEESFIVTRPPEDVVSPGVDLISNPPSPAGLSNEQIEQLMIHIRDLQFENNDLRNNLDETNNVMQSKLQMIRDLETNQKKWMETVKERQKKTSESNRKLRKEKKDLEQQLDKLQMTIGGTNGSSGNIGDKILCKLQNDLQQSVLRVAQLEKERLLGAGDDDTMGEDNNTLPNKLRAESAKVKTLEKDLQKSLESTAQLEEELKKTKAELSKIKESNRKDMQMLRAKLDESLTKNQMEIANYKQQITSVLSELKDKDRTVTNQRSKIGELHKANNEFDSLTKALGEKLSMYDEQFSVFQQDRQSFEKRHSEHVTYLKSSLQQEQHRQEMFKKEKHQLESNMQEAFKERDKLVQENWNLKSQIHKMNDDLGRVAAEKISLEESLEARTEEIARLKKDLGDKQLEERRVRQDFLQATRNHQSFQTEKSNMEGIIKELQQQLQVQREKNARLERDVEKHNQEKLREMQNRYDSMYQPQRHLYTKESPTRDNLNYQQRMPQYEPPPQTEFICPMCNEKYAEFESLSIHVQDCVK